MNAYQIEFVVAVLIMPVVYLASLRLIKNNKHRGLAAVLWYIAVLLLWKAGLMR